MRSTESITLRDSGRAAIIAVTICCAVSFAGCGGPSLRWTSGPLPSSITKEWYRANFDDCIDMCEIPRQDSLWVAVRNRADFLRAMIAVVEDPETHSFNRANTILRLGATNQDSAYRYIISRLDLLPSNSEFTPNWVLSLGSGYTTLPPFVYEALQRQMQHGDRIHPASVVLKDIGTLRSRQILETAVLAVPPDRRDLVTAALRDWKHRPWRE